MFDRSGSRSFAQTVTRTRRTCDIDCTRIPQRMCRAAPLAARLVRRCVQVVFASLPCTIRWRPPIVFVSACLKLTSCAGVCVNCCDDCGCLVLLLLLLSLFLVLAPGHHVSLQSIEWSVFEQCGCYCFQNRLVGTRSCGGYRT